MGNGALGGILGNGMSFPCQIKIGRYVSITLIKIKENKLEDKDEDEDEDETPNNLTKVTYAVGEWSKCDLEFRVSNNGNTTSFTLGDCNKNTALNIHFTIKKVEPFYLEISPFAPRFHCLRGDFKLTELESISDSTKCNNEWRGFTESDFLIYETERTNGGLVVMERKKNNKDQKPFMVTVAHYYFVRDIYNIDIGISVIVRVESLKNGGLYFTAEGPTAHPAAALVYMCDEVSRTGVWKPTSCPHCATIQEQQFSRAKGSFSRRGINNDGTFKGNGSGNMIQGDFNQFTIYRK